MQGMITNMDRDPEDLLALEKEKKGGKKKDTHATRERSPKAWGKQPILKKGFGHRGREKKKSGRKSTRRSAMFRRTGREKPSGRTKHIAPSFLQEKGGKAVN